MDPNQQPQNNQVPEPVPAPVFPQTPQPEMHQTFQPQTQPTQQPVPPVYTAEQPAFQNPQPSVAPQASTFSANPSPAVVRSHNPGSAMGLASLILCLVGLGLFGLIFGIIAFKKSRRAGMKNKLAVAGIILGSLEIIAGIIAIIFIAMWLSLLFSTCQELGSGTHVLTSGQSLTCSV